MPGRTLVKPFAAPPLPPRPSSMCLACCWAAWLSPLLMLVGRQPFSNLIAGIMATTTAAAAAMVCTLGLGRGGGGGGAAPVTVRRDGCSVLDAGQLRARARTRPSHSPALLPDVPPQVRNTAALTSMRAGIADNVLPDVRGTHMAGGLPAPQFALGAGPGEYNHALPMTGDLGWCYPWAWGACVGCCPACACENDAASRARDRRAKWQAVLAKRSWPACSHQTPGPGAASAVRARAAPPAWCAVRIHGSKAGSR